MDIAINFITEQQTGELTQTTTIKESTKAYLTRFFLFDSLSAIFVCIIAFSPREYILTHFWDHLLHSFFIEVEPVLAPEEVEILDRFREFSPASHNVSADSFAYTMAKVAENMQSWDDYRVKFFWISFPLILLKFVNLSRTRSILTYVENLFQSTGAYV
mmetsp:Transcript_37561/g.57536  ORF Transcript_37561/g.57536 Transcript_37561/m.57536 type:complete len:159 (-) Transcript_37561:2671-3147(-)